MSPQEEALQKERERERAKQGKPYLFWCFLINSFIFYYGFKEGKYFF